ncbi:MULTISPECIES: hypothetical protein [Luteibacter]|nr:MULTISPECIES: hypothetical protein [Luteibacter]SFW70384.1 hypothetical protein SAMN02800691_3104 [Luteibacter sp. UNCMF366Tsu5.1]
MDRILSLQLLEPETESSDETNTNYSSCSHRACSMANADAFED